MLKRKKFRRRDISGREISRMSHTAGAHARTIDRYTTNKKREPLTNGNRRRVARRAPGAASSIDRVPKHGRVSIESGQAARIARALYAAAPPHDHCRLLIISVWQIP